MWLLCLSVVTPDYTCRHVSGSLVSRVWTVWSSFPGKWLSAFWGHGVTGSNIVFKVTCSDMLCNIVGSSRPKYKTHIFIQFESCWFISLLLNLTLFAYLLLQFLTDSDKSSVNRRHWVCRCAKWSWIFEIWSEVKGREEKHENSSFSERSMKVLYRFLR